MYRHDYIVRMFSELGKVIAAILKLKKEERFFEAEQTVNGFLKQFSETDLDFLLSMEPGQLLIELTEKRKLEEERIQLIAEMLYQYGTIRKEQLINEDYSIYFTRSLALFQFLLRNQTQNFNMEVLQRINTLENLLRSHED